MLTALGTLPPAPDYGLGFIQQYFRRGEFGSDPATILARQNDLEAPLITLAFVLVPLARAEANRARRQFDAALRDLRWVLDSIAIGQMFPTSPNPGPIQTVCARLACEFIELPFAGCCSLKRCWIRRTPNTRPALLQTPHRRLMSPPTRA